MENGEAKQRQRRDAGEQQQRRVVQRQRRAEQHMQQIDIRTFQRDDGDAKRQRYKVKGGERGVLAQRRKAAAAPEASATTSPAASPPSVIAGSDRPATR